MRSFSSEAINPSLPIMTLDDGKLKLHVQNNLSPVDIAKINRKYICANSNHKKYDKGENIQNAVSWKKFLYAQRY